MPPPCYTDPGDLLILVSKKLPNDLKMILDLSTGPYMECRRSLSYCDRPSLMDVLAERLVILFLLVNYSDRSNKSRNRLEKTKYAPIIITKTPIIPSSVS
jgi:hypothetical protein